jgi:uncharacterized membrane protein SpoIIM required for sporulation
MAAFTLKSFEFRRERESSWRELDDLVTRIEQGGITALREDELRRLPLLYRGALSSLSVARAISLDKNVVIYLESLAARAYVCVYSTNRRWGEAVLAFFTTRFPALVWGMRRSLWVAGAVMILGVVVGFAMTAAEPERFYSFVDPAMAGGRGPSSTREELASVLRSTGGDEGGALTAFASFLFTHNAKIGMLCLVLGFLAGVPVLLLLFINGLTLGAMIAVHWHKDLTIEFLTWVMPHGVTELLAVCLCGAAGLVVGHSLVFPGEHRRLDSLAARGREAGAVVIGAVMLFFIAALIEGFFRQLVHDVVPRAVLSLLTLAGWIVYFARGRPRREPAPAAAGGAAGGPPSMRRPPMATEPPRLGGAEGA